MKKPNMLRVLVTTVSVAACALAARPAHGQDAPVKPASAASSATVPSEEHLKVENNLIWFRVPGKPWKNLVGPATVGKAVEALRELYPDSSFAIDPRVAELPLTDLVIRGNEPMTDLRALRTACGGGFDLGGDPSLQLLQHNSATEFNLSKKEDRNIECFNLTGYLGRIITPEDEKNPQTDEAKALDKDKRANQTQEAVAQLQSIIGDTIKDFDATIAEPRFRFYPQAQLLIVTGSQRGIEIAANVIRALPGQPTAWGYTVVGGDLRNNSRDRQLLEQMQADQSADANSTKPLLIGVVPPGVSPKKEQH
jgi:hypothetical protein